jgi:hypothetical protein
MSKSVRTGWQRAMRWLDAPKLKKWYKAFVNRRNRRKAKRNPEAKDKPLDPWDID